MRSIAGRRSFTLVMAAMGLAACASRTDDEGTQSDDALTVCPGATVEGIDVSEFQGSIDWSRVKGSGRAFSMIRVSDGTGHLDPTFDANWSGAHAAGVLRSVYQFFRPTQDANAQADLVIRTLAQAGAGELPPMLDVEVADGASGSQIRAGIAAWSSKIQQATGRVPLIYTAPGFWNGSVGGGAESDPLVVASWGVSCPSVPNSWSTWKFWQYTDSGSVPGIGGAVDLDRFNGSLTDLEAFAQVAKPQRTVQFFEGDFNGDGKSDLLFYNEPDSNWWLGLSDGNTIGWHLAGNTKGFGGLIDPANKRFFSGDFNGDGKADVAFYNQIDSNWWLGFSDGSAINWHLAANTKGFGGLIDPANKWFFSGDFNGDGKEDIGFYNQPDSNWWVGFSNGSAIDWHLAANTKGFGGLIDPANKRFFSGDFNGDGKADVAFYNQLDSNWWVGSSDGNAISWHLAGNTKGFGGLIDPANKAFFSGDFNGDGKADVAFYSQSDSHWWLGLSDGSAINWHLGGDTKGFGGLIDPANKAFFSGDFNGDGKTDIAFYNQLDSNWWAGLSDGNAISWHLMGNTKGFGGLIDPANKEFFHGDFNGDHRADVMFYYNGDSNWWSGLSNGNAIDWHLAGNTKGFGNLIR